MEMGTEWLIGNLFSAWVKISINHPVILMLALSLCVSDIKLQTNGRKSLGLDGAPFASSVWSQEGTVTWPCWLLG